MRAHEEEQSYTMERKIAVGIAFKSQFLLQDSNEITLRVRLIKGKRAFKKISTMSKNCDKIYLLTYLSRYKSQRSHQPLLLYYILKNNIIHCTPPHFIKNI